MKFTSLLLAPLTLMLASASIAQEAPIDLAIKAFAEGDFTKARALAEKNEDSKADDLAKWLQKASLSHEAKDGKVIKEYEGHFYSCVTANRKWGEAKILAEKLGGQLAIIETKEENDFLKKEIVMKVDGNNDGYASFWLGASRTENSDNTDFAWLNGIKIMQSYWHPGEPNGIKGKNGELPIYLCYYRKHEIAGWDDCVDTTLVFIIEWSKLPESNHFELDFIANALECDDARYTNLLKTTEQQWGVRITPLQGKLEKLNASYKTAIERAIQAATTAGNLEEVIALKKEAESLDPKQPCSHALLENAPPSLEKLVTVYEKSWNDIKAAIDTERQTVTATFITNLEKLEELLTKEVKITDAKAVRDLRNSLASSQTKDSPKEGLSPDTTVTPMASKDFEENIKAAQALPNADLKQAILPVLQAGGFVIIAKKDETIYITKEAQIPTKTEGWEFKEIRCDSSEKYSKNPLKQEDFDRFAQSEGLYKVSFNNIGVSPANLRFLATCPNIQFISFHASGFTDDCFRYLKNCENLNTISLVSCSKVTGVGLAHIKSHEKMLTLDLRQCHSAPAVMVEVGKMKELQTLNLQRGTITNADLYHLASCKKLGLLDLSNHPANALGLTAVGKLPCNFLAISFDSKADLAEQGQAIFKACPDLQTFRFPDLGSAHSSHVEALVSALPKLKSISLHRTNFTDDVISALAAAEKLESLSLSGCKVEDSDMKSIVTMKNLKYLGIAGTAVSDLSLPLLAEMRKLGQVDVTGCTNITIRGAETFRKKARGVILIK